jgi:hypothetical protein
MDLTGQCDEAVSLSEKCRDQTMRDRAKKVVEEEYGYLVHTATKHRQLAILIDCSAQCYCVEFTALRVI